MRNHCYHKARSCWKTKFQIIKSNFSSFLRFHGSSFYTSQISPIFQDEVLKVYLLRCFWNSAKSYVKKHEEERDFAWHNFITHCKDFCKARTNAKKAIEEWLFRKWVRRIPFTILWPYYTYYLIFLCRRNL